MAEPFLAEIRIFGFNFAPRGWAFCQGQILPIAQNQSLYSLLGTTYGGDGRTTFALPDLRGRAPFHRNEGVGLSNRTLGEKGGVEAQAVTAAEMPPHSHTVFGTRGNATADHVEGAMPAVSEAPAYGPGPGNTGMSSQSLSTVFGLGWTHDNMQPFMAVNFSIALQGVFPSRN